MFRDWFSRTVCFGIEYPGSDRILYRIGTGTGEVLVVVSTSKLNVWNERHALELQYMFIY